LLDLNPALKGRAKLGLRRGGDLRTRFINSRTSDRFHAPRPFVIIGARFIDVLPLLFATSVARRPFESIRFIPEII
jgi:hypothetical protein